MKRTLLIATALAATNAFAWSDVGHGAIVTLAYRHLTPAAKAKVDELVKVGVEPRYHNIVMSSNWADEFRSDNANTGPWHYINIHFRTDGKPVTMKHLDENVCWAINKFRVQLKDPNKEKQAEALRWILHCVGDAHQPLHNVARDTDKTPEGDRGGNDFAIVPGNGLPDWNTNLHRVWDSGCGAFALPMRAWEPGADAAIKKLADEIEALHPKSSMTKEITDLDPFKWAQDGFEIAKRFAYTAPEGGTPSLAYVQTGQKISLQRAALAAYRLAAILNENLK